MADLLTREPLMASMIEQALESQALHHQNTLALGRMFSQPVVAHAFNPRTWEAEAGGFLSWRPAWSSE